MSSNAYKLDYDYPRKPHISDFFKVGSKTQQKKKPQVTELYIEYKYKQIPEITSGGFSCAGIGDVNTSILDKYLQIDCGQVALDKIQ